MRFNESWSAYFYHQPLPLTEISYNSFQAESEHFTLFYKSDVKFETVLLQITYEKAVGAIPAVL